MTAAERGISVPRLRAITLNCSLKPTSDENSSTDQLLGELAEQLRTHDVEVDGPVRIADENVSAGVTSDEGDGDGWPGLRERILAADILVIGSGQRRPSCGPSQGDALPRLTARQRRSDASSERA